MATAWPRWIRAGRIVKGICVGGSGTARAYPNGHSFYERNFVENEWNAKEGFEEVRGKLATSTFVGPLCCVLSRLEICPLPHKRKKEKKLRKNRVKGTGRKQYHQSVWAASTTSGESKESMEGIRDAVGGGGI